MIFAENGPFFRDRALPSAIMQKLTFIAASIFAAFAFAPSQAPAQMASQNGQTQPSIQGGAVGSATGGTAAPTRAPIGGVFCIEEMTANFCNMITGPNIGGYGGRSGSASASGAASASSASTTSAGGGGPSSIPPCPAEPPFNELCN